MGLLVQGAGQVISAPPAAAVNLTVNTSAPFTGGTPAIPPGLMNQVIFYNGANRFRCGGFNVVLNQLTACNALGIAGFNFTPANNSAITTAYLSNSGTPLIGGFLKIERQDTNFVWTDVTNQILGYGLTAGNQNGACANPSPNAIIRLQRVADVVPSQFPAPAGCAAGVQGTDYWPLSLFDAREGLVRDVAPGVLNPTLGGLMYYVQLDVANLSQWFLGNGFTRLDRAQARRPEQWLLGLLLRPAQQPQRRERDGRIRIRRRRQSADGCGNPNGISIGARISTGTTRSKPTARIRLQRRGGNASGSGGALNGAARPWTQVTALQAKVEPSDLLPPCAQAVNGGLTQSCRPA